MKKIFYAPQDSADLKREKEAARELRASSWWKQKVSAGVCYYCEKKFGADVLTMDHIVPLGRGGKSVRSNIVTACKDCNSQKQSRTAVELLLENLQIEN